jgi:hypothetical protein
MFRQAMTEVGWFAVTGVRLQGSPGTQGFLPVRKNTYLCSSVFICVSKFLLGSTKRPIAR